MHPIKTTYQNGWNFRGIKSLMLKNRTAPRIMTIHANAVLDSISDAIIITPQIATPTTPVSAAPTLN